MDNKATVGIVTICGAEHLRRCLDALSQQEGSPSFEILAVYGPRLKEVAELSNHFPGVRFIAAEDAPTPPELACRAIREAGGEIILLTEDHCRPQNTWVRKLCEAQSPEFAAVGGIVEAEDYISAVDWAVYWVDFFRYARPVREGPSPTLTHCNISYMRSHLDAVSEVWKEIFHETAVNNALKKHFGELRLIDAGVRMHRHVSLREALAERYRYGRLFGCQRLQFCTPGGRLFYAMLSPALPVLLMGRMTVGALSKPRLLFLFLRSLPILTLLTVSWSVGESLGYLTGRRPSSLRAAKETK